MVATKLSEVAGKGWRSLDATTTGGKNERGESNRKSSGNVSSSSSYLESASESLQQAGESAYSGITSAISTLPTLWKAETSAATKNNIGLKQTDSDDVLSSSSVSAGSGLSSQRRRGSVTLLSPNLLKMIHNPYIGVRGGGRQHKAKAPNESMDAVRKLLYVVDDNKNNRPSIVAGGVARPTEMPQSPQLTPFSDASPLPFSEAYDSTHTPRRRNSNTNSYNSDMQYERSQVQSLLSHELTTIDSMRSKEEDFGEELPLEAVEKELDQQAEQAEASGGKTAQKDHPFSSSYSASPEETASQLTEGTLRAMRDLALDEAVELHASLKYWSDRWERPIFSWFVAGPMVWFGLNAKKNHHQSSQNASRYSMIGGGGYDHAVMVGQKVSQIQAVLARRLSAIGELQQHLLRAGWQRGVAQWGFLGEGGDWAAVAGADGRMTDHDSVEQSFEDDGDDDDVGAGDEGTEQGLQHYHGDADSFLDQEFLSPENESLDGASSYQNYNQNGRYRPQLRREYSEASVGSVGMHFDVAPPPPDFTTPRRRNSSMIESRRKQGSLYYTNLTVRKRKGGRIHTDNPALAEWSVDAMALIRSQLSRAASGKIALPCAENWPFEFAPASHPSAVAQDDKTIHYAPTDTGLPAWVAMKSVPSRTRKRICTTSSYPILENEYDDQRPRNVDFPKIGAECFDDPPVGTEETNPSKHHSVSSPDLKEPLLRKRRSPTQQQNRQRLLSSSPNSCVAENSVLSISDLPLMMNEVSALLDVMEDIIDVQRARRLQKLKPPPWWRQNWFLVAMVPPSVAYLVYNNAVGKRRAWNLVKFAAQKILDFAREHVVLPCVALYEEITTGPDSISDHKARDTVIETLKKMIRSWLDETYPEMLEAEKERLSDAMDITLVEQAKEESMKSVYNMNSVIRMSFIEAQFIKKEMMNALVAMDEMQASTNFNMNLAAITPFVLLMWTVKKISVFVFYTTFKWGKSRRETYRSFLDALTEIERLLIMRSNPPAPPPAIGGPETARGSGCTYRHHEPHALPAIGDCVLGSDDLGMLMLHVHELRTILWQERRRFSQTALRSVSEDLAELSGERGAVSVRQQLLIVERMNRAYGFLKQGAID